MRLNPFWFLPCTSKSNCFQILCLFEMGRQGTVVKCCKNWQGQSYGLDVETLLAVKYGAQRVTRKKSLTSHLEVGLMDTRS